MYIRVYNYNAANQPVKCRDLRLLGNLGPDLLDNAAVLVDVVAVAEDLRAPNQTGDSLGSALDRGQPAALGDQLRALQVTDPFHLSREMMLHAKNVTTLLSFNF